MTVIIRRVVVAALLSVWSFPGLAAANTNSAPPPAVSAPSTSLAGTLAAAAGVEQAELAARERQARDLEGFRGGGVSVYIGGGTLLVVAIILLILLV